VAECRWYNSESHSTETNMSADRDRGIRRQRQKRVKEQKKQVRQQKTVAASARSANPSPKQQAA